MSLTSSQIVNLALQISKTGMSGVGFTSQAGQLLNMVLSDLAQTYDFDVARGSFGFSFNVALGSGPYPLPADYLRAERNEVFYTISGVPYVMTPIDLSEFDSLVQTAGNTAYPQLYATDTSQSPPVMYVWAPPSGNFPVTLRYRRQMPDIATPETSSVVPWFPNSDYLVTRLAGELCKLADDDRAAALLGDDPMGAMGILRRYLQMKDDAATRAQSVSLDKRRFGPRFNSLQNTKTIGW